MGSGGNGNADSGASALANLGLKLRRGQDGVLVTDVDPDSAAAEKGLKEGDLILEVAGKSVTRPSEVAQAIEHYQERRQKERSDACEVEEGEHFLALPTRAS